VEPQSPPADSDNVRHIELVSPLLSAFHGRVMKLRAAVVLPAGHDDHPEARYPVLYTITGFGGSYARTARMMGWVAGRHDAAKSVIHVVPDASCYRGHHVFADSANNGPWGRALVEELMPHIEKTFPALPGAAHRYVTGVSSGGWSALWLQVAYPDAFNGCYAHTPDPVDFRDFQRINLYARGANMYRDESGNRRPLMREGDAVLVWYQDFAHMEDVLGPGGQLHSFEACFSPKGPDGEPLELWDRKTGAVDPVVAKSWEPYDIRLVLERNWPALGPKLAGKLHVYAGGMDNFFLEGAVRLLKESLEKLGSDADVELFPEAGHGMIQSKVGPMFEHIKKASPVQGQASFPPAAAGRTSPVEVTGRESAP
jgi:S-formylglutathione hydrolase FrmB